ncbi:MAG: S8 family serine peptidase [Gemmataceae bacterium]
MNRSRSTTRKPAVPSNALRRRLEALEDRVVPTSHAFAVNDPDFPSLQWGLNNVRQSNPFSAAGGKYGVDIDMPAAWSVTTGKMTTVLAMLDDGVDYTNPDLYLNIWVNPGEIPAALKAGLTDTDADGLITFRDLNASANAAFVSDRNGNGYIDGGDLLKDPRWADGVDGDNNGRVDDLIGWDFQDNDNNPMPGPTGGHGTKQAQQIGGIPNNGIGEAGVNWQISIMPVRIHPDGNNINYTNAAAGLDYAVAEGVPISNNSWGNDTYSQVMYDAINRARAAGHLFVAAAGNQGRDTDVTPFYPACFDLDNIVSVGSFDPNGNRINNWGHTSVDLAAPTPAGTSGSSSNTSGVAALLKTSHPDWGYAQIKGRILSTADPSPAFAGLTVTGGLLNAAFALAPTCIAVDAPSVVEGDAGTTQLVFTVRRVGDSTGAVTLNWSTADGTATAGSDYVAASGQITFPAGGGSTQTITVSLNGDTIPEPSKTLYVNLSPASGSALLADGDGQGTIVDNDTKFYVVDDGSTNRTYRYGVSGNALANSALAAGDTAPRGAASTASGAKVWVVDANKTVYVYSPSGGLLGSWTAGGLNPSAQVEGIATNGTDIWLLDNKQDKVFKYAGAAGRLSGSQTAASSFNLTSADSNGKGIVTDGASLWVVDDGSSVDKVYKYTLTGSLVGSWAIDPANAHPTGITINPANVSDVWVVDNVTLKVYQYTAAAGRTSGSQSAAATFTLAAGNTNPQDIADPPALSIGDAAATEGGTAYRFTDKFVAPDGYGLAAVRNLQLGPDGNVYVASHDTDVVEVFEGGTGRFLRNLSTPGGELDGPWGTVFGPDGRLYVGGRYSHNVVRFDIGTGSYAVFVPANSGGLGSPRGLAFGSDGNLYASSGSDSTGDPSADTVKRFNGATGAYIGNFVAAGSGGLTNVNGIAFGPDGNLYVASNVTLEVKRYSGQTGAFIDNFVPAGSGGIGGARNIIIPGDGYLYLTDANASTNVFRYSATTGAFVDVFALGPPGNGQLGGNGMAFAHSGELYVTEGGPTLQPGSYVARFAPTSFAAFTVSLDAASATPISVSFATANGTAVAGSDYTAASGTITFAPGETTRAVLVRTLDDALAEPTETFIVNLSNPVGATISHGQGIGTITDNDPPALRVASVAVNGGAAQRSRVTQLAVTFSGVAQLPANPAAAFRLARLGGGPVGGFTATAATVGGVTVVTLANFTGAETAGGSLADGRYALTVLASQLASLDGNGDGTAGDDYVLNGTATNGLFRYYGDADGDGDVDGSDLFAYVPTVFNANNYISAFDFDGDGDVDGTDLFKFVQNLFIQLP